MAPSRSSLRFLLNGTPVSLASVKATDTLLDWLRLDHRLTGSKEGCAEGDCGACTVLVGRLAADGELIYESVNACIRLMGSLDGTHVVTIEHLRRADGTLHPVQQAMVDHHGSQCGFCTPGIVMSLYALWMQTPNPSRAQAETALQGNLCRCTGYRPIIDAACQIAGEPAQDRLVTERDTVRQTLQGWRDGTSVQIDADGSCVIVPADLDAALTAYAANPDATIIAGSTDVGLWVTKFLRDVSPAIFINNLTDLQSIETCADGLRIGAGVTYSDAAEAMARHAPQLAGFWNRIGGWQVRNMGTVGGNIANGSPIGDTPPPLIALGAKLHLASADAKRTVLLEDFFIDYGKQDRQRAELVTGVTIPPLAPDARFAAYKISKRRDEDISALCAAFYLEFDNDGRVATARLAFGGMAATPKRAPAAEAALTGKPFGPDAIRAAKAALAQDFTPLTDWRASSTYRATAAANLLDRLFAETSGETAQLERLT